jgi:hypothetical protein
LQVLQGWIEHANCVTPRSYAREEESALRNEFMLCYLMPFDLDGTSTLPDRFCVMLPLCYQSLSAPGASNG